MTENLKIIERALQKTGYTFEYCGFGSEPKVEWGAYFEETTIAFNADNDEVSEQCLTGKILFFTRDNTGRPKAKIESVLRQIEDLNLSPANVTFNMNDKILCYEWTWTLI